MAIKLIAIDIDGTLVNDQKQLTQHTIDTIAKARQKASRSSYVLAGPSLVSSNTLNR